MGDRVHEKKATGGQMLMSDQGQRLTQMLDRIEVQFQVMQKLQDCFSTIEVPERNGQISYGQLYGRLCYGCIRWYKGGQVRLD